MFCVVSIYDRLDGEGALNDKKVATRGSLILSFQEHKFPDFLKTFLLYDLHILSTLVNWFSFFYSKQFRSHP